jgi:hypothetical protein
VSAETPAPFKAADGVPIVDLFLRDPELLKTVLQMYEKDGSGPLGGFFIPMAQTKLRETFAQPSFLPGLMKNVSPGEGRRRKKLEERTMDLFALEDGATAMHQMAKAQFNIAGHTQITKTMTPTTPENFWTLLVSMNHPFSRGNVQITSPPPPTIHESA